MSKRLQPADNSVGFSHSGIREFICKTCGATFQSKKACKSREPKFCSKNCYAQSLCKPKPEKKPRVSRKGMPLSPAWKKALSEGRKKSAKCKGENLYNWKGGPATLKERMKLHYYKRKSSQSIKPDSDFLQKLIQAQENKCFYCDADLTAYKAIEHLTPLSRGGDNHNYNMVYSCKSCNSKKKNKTLEEVAVNTGRFYLLDKFDYIYASSIN